MSSSNTSDRYPLIPLTINPLLATIDEDFQNLFSADMTLVHNVIIRGINSIWRNAPLVKPGDAQAFAGYCLVCMDVIHVHHSGEEAFIFPFLQTKLDMGHNLEQHEAFHGPMEVFKAYMERVQSGKEEYDGQKAQSLVEDFGELLVTHLHDFARETRLSSDEWMAALNFLVACGQISNEVRHVSPPGPPPLPHAAAVAPRRASG